MLRTEDRCGDMCQALINPQTTDQCGAFTGDDGCGAPRRVFCGCPFPNACGAVGTSKVCAPFSGNAIWGSSSTDIWAVGAFGAILHFNGTRWDQDESPTTETLRGVSGRVPGDVWAVGGDTQALVLHRIGTAWTVDAKFPSPQVLGPLYGVWGEPQGDMWAVGASGADPQKKGTFVRWNDTNLPLSMPVESPLYAIWGFPAAPSSNQTTEVWAVGAGGAAYHVVDDFSGNPPSLEFFPIPPRSTNVFDDLYAVWGSNLTDVWALGTTGNGYGWNASSWVLRPHGASDATVRGVWGSDLNNAWSVSDGGTIHYRSASTPSDPWRRDFTTPLSGAQKNLHGVWGSSSTNVWAVGDGVILRRNPLGAGEAWEIWTQ